MSRDYRLGDLVTVKKPHPCAKSARRFVIERVGEMVKMRCESCDTLVRIDRQKLDQQVVEIERGEGR